MTTATVLATTESPPIVVPWDDVLTDVQKQEDAEAPVCQIAGCEHTAFCTCEYCEKPVCLVHHRVYVGFCQVDRDYCVTCYTSRTWREAAMLAETSEAYQRHLYRLRSAA